MSAKTRDNHPLTIGAGEPGSRELLGGKAYGLWRMERLGLPIPPWIAVTTTAAAMVLEPIRSQLEQLLTSLPAGDAAGLERVATEMQVLVRTARWPSSVTEAVQHAGATLGAERLAVRSSAFEEDGTRDSYAGQMATFLAETAVELENAVRECWASAFSARVLRYRQAQGITPTMPCMAAIIQVMIESRVSGVVFTADPVTGAPAEVIVAGLGLGEGVVGELVEVDTFRREFGHGQWVANVRAKTHQVISRGDSRGTRLADVPVELRDQPALTAGQLESLSTLARRIDTAAKAPQDVEWAFDSTGRCWILQARPVTTAPAGRIAVWEDANIGESYPGVTLPFTYSYVRFVYQHLFGRALTQVGVPRRVVRRSAPLLRHLIGTVRGRLYLNLTNYYAMFALVPGLERRIPEWERGFGITESSHAGPFTPGPTLRGGLRVLGRVRTAVLLALRFLLHPLAVRRLHSRVERLISRVDSAGVEAESLDGLLDLWESINHEFLDAWTVMIFNDLFMLPFLTRLTTLSGGADLQQQLISGFGNLRSLEPLQSLLALSSEAARNPAVATLLESSLAAPEVWHALQRSAAAKSFHQQAQRHLEIHGHRVVEELKFETIPPNEEPWQLVPLLRALLGTGKDSKMISPERSVSAETRLRERCGRSRTKWWYAQWILRMARRGVADRENMSYARSRAYAKLRTIVQAMGDALVRAHALGNRRDVFYLRLEDIVGYSRGGLPEGELKGLVELRRQAYAGFAAIRSMPRILARGSVYAQAPIVAPSVPTSANAVLRGTPSAPGMARGTIQVVLEPAVTRVADGQILVAPATEPGWMFLMARAAGLIVERGSVLSHAAIIGRELGLPTIVGVDGATHRLASGDEVEMNGSTGEIRVLRSAVATGR